MSRWMLPTLAFVALTACKQPKGVEVDGRQLMPADATFAFGFEVGALRGSPLGSMLHGAMQGDADLRALFEAVGGCDLEVDQIRGFLAGTPENTDRFFAYIEGGKIGDNDNVRCIEKGFAKATGEKDGLLLFKTQGEVQTLDQEGGGKLIVLNHNALAFANGGWETGVLTAIETPESRNTTSGLAKAVATIDPGSDVWIALAFGDADRASWTDLPGGDGIQAITGVADLAQGMKLTANVDGRDAANAAMLEGSLRLMLAEGRASLVEMGLPEALVDSTKISSKETRVTATVDVAADAMPAVVTALASIAAGG